MKQLTLLTIGLLLSIINFTSNAQTESSFTTSNGWIKDLESDPAKLNNPEEVPIEYIWGLLDASKQGSPEHRKEIIKRSLEGNILAMSFLSEIPGIYKDGQVYEGLMQQIQINGLKNNYYYSYAVNILSALKEMELSDDERSAKLQTFKDLYRKTFAYMHFDESINYPYLMAMADRSIDIIWSDTSSSTREGLKKKYGRYPQKFEVYLSVPEIVNIYFESFQLINKVEFYQKDPQLQEDYDLPFIISATMAEGFILNARYFVRGTEMFRHMNYPMGLDRFGNTLPELKQKGYLDTDFDGFVYADSTFTYEGADADYKMGEFKTQNDLLLGYSALYFEDRDAFFRDLKGYKYDPQTLNRDERRVGTMLRMVSGYTGEEIKKHGPNLIGQGKRHGDGLYNAQWAAATAEYLEQMYGDIFMAFYNGEKININDLKIDLPITLEIKNKKAKVLEEAAPITLPADGGDKR